MTRRSKVMIALALVAAQAALVGVYFAVESERAEAQRRASLSTEPPRPAAGEVDTFEVMLRDGSTRQLIGAERPVLIHFWATWCPPCLDELPLVLGLPDEEFDVVAVALDEEWAKIDRFVGAHDATRVVRASPEIAAEKFDASSLPESILMAPDGRLLMRATGARDWSDPAFRTRWEKAARENREAQGRQ